MALLVNDTTPRVQYTATAGQTVFEYPFAIFADADLDVYQVSSSGTPDDTNDILTLTTHYTVSGAGDTSGGNVTLVTGATAGDIITIKRDIAIERTTDYQNLGDLASASFNDDLDKLIMMVQQNEEGLNRALTLANSSQVSGNFDVDDPIAGYFARAKSDLSGIEWLNTQSVGNLSVSAYIETLLDDATSLAARDTLEVIKEGVYRGIAGGTADALTVSLSPTMTALSDGQIIFVRALLANATTTPTIDMDGLGAKTITKNGNQALVAGDISRVDDELILRYNSSNDVWELLNPSVAQSVLNNSNHISGLILSNDTDTDHDINITAGYANDSTNAYSMNLASEITKQIDATWAAGDDAGGLFSGSVAVDTWYHVFLIRKDSDGSIDAGFDTSVTAANIPTDYTAYKWIGAVLTDGSANILPFTQSAQYPNRVSWVTRVQDLSDTTMATSKTNVTLSVPPDIEVLALCNAYMQASITAKAFFYNNGDSGTGEPSNSADIVVGSSGNFGNINFERVTNTSSQISYKGSTASAIANFRINTLGWEVDRGAV